MSNHFTGILKNMSVRHGAGVLYIDCCIVAMGRRGVSITSEQNQNTLIQGVSYKSTASLLKYQVNYECWQAFRGLELVHLIY